MLKKVRIDIVTDSGDAIEHEVIELPKYEVKKLQGFFEVYGFTDDEEADIRQRFDDGDSLTVFQDGSAIWGDGEMLLNGGDEAIPDEEFAEEARRAGSQVVEGLYSDRQS